LLVAEAGLVVRRIEESRSQLKSAQSISGLLGYEGAATAP
jgi:hypothetical protein